LKWGLLTVLVRLERLLQLLVDLEHSLPVGSELMLLLLVC